MPRHAQPTRSRPHRSDSAARAHRAGTVTHTITIGGTATLDRRHRATAVLGHHAWALGVAAIGFWIYDIGLLVHH